MTQERAASRAIRYPFLDGLRGLAAFYVVMHHAAFEMGGEPLPASLSWWLAPWAYGHDAVGVFIALSGFLIALPIVSSPELVLRGGALAYLGRRARRVLPPYYAALAVILGLMALVPVLRTAVTPRWGDALPAFGRGSILSHLVLLHDLSPNWVWQIDPPMWSIAVEWQIYWLFLGLLVVWRRWGVWAMLAAAWVVGNFDLFTVMAGWPPLYSGAYPWYLFIFAAGAAGARLALMPGHGRWWGLAGLAVLAVSMLMMVSGGPPTRLHDHLFGLGVVAVLVACARSARTPDALFTGLRRAIESPVPMGLGRFSYSLYLVHFPLVAWTHGFMLARHWQPATRLVLLLTATPLLAVGVAWLFYLAFERTTLGPGR